MIPDTISGDGTNPNEGENAQITDKKNFTPNEELEKQKEYRQDQSNNKASNDPTAERNVGPKSALGLQRGLNNQWNKNGLMYAFPIR